MPGPRTFRFRTCRSCSRRSWKGCACWRTERTWTAPSGAAAFAEPDGSGRISIPASQRSAVGIEKKAVLLGMGDKFELWSEQAHHAQIRQTLGDADLGEDLLDLAL